MVHKGTVLLETERLILRRYTMDDLLPMYNNCWSDPEVVKWTSYKPMNSVEEVMTVADMFTEKWLGFYERPNRYSWAIVLKATDEVIGRFFGMYPDDYLSEIELAYELGRQWWNQGLITEAVNRVIDFFFSEVGFNRICAYYAKGNEASGRVMEKCNMQFEGVMRQACRCNAGTFDKYYYGILREDYMK